MPCFGRPLRTRRAIQAIAAQNTGPWEALIVGDGCPDFRRMLDALWFKELSKKVEQQGNGMYAWNTAVNMGGFGYWQTNWAISHAAGKYFVFMANDDMILPYHFQYYLSQIEGTDLDFVYFDGSIQGKHTPYKLKYGHIGHNALIIRTAFLREMPPHSKGYGHDWTLIENMLRHGAKYRKSCSTLTTYEIMSSPRDRRDPDGIN